MPFAIDLRPFAKDAERLLGPRTEADLLDDGGRHDLLARKHAPRHGVGAALAHVVTIFARVSGYGG